MATLLTTARRHWLFLVLLVVGLALRVTVLCTYRPAFWYDGDSGSFLASALSTPVRPQPHRALGYVLLLKAFRPTGAVLPLIVLQHLVGLAVAVAVYALLRRRAVAPWLACLACVPLLFDGSLVTIEHHVLSDSVALALVSASMITLLWRPVPGPASAGAAGGVLALAWFVRPLALPVAAVVLAYLLLRRLPVRVSIAFAIAFAVPCAAMLLWVDGRPSPYGSNALALYGRLANVADCARIQLSPAERRLCAPPGHRPDWYAWSPTSPAYPDRHDVNDPVMRTFAYDVLRQQPVDYARAVTGEIAAAVLPGVGVDQIYACLPGRYAMPATAREPESGPLGCHPELAQPDFKVGPQARALDPAATPLTTTLAAYSRWSVTPRLFVAGALLLAAIAYLLRRRGDPALGRDSAMLAVAAVATIVLPIAAGMYDPRYVLAALPLLCLGTGLGAQQIALLRRRRRTTPVSPATIARTAPDPAAAVRVRPTTHRRR